MTRTRRTKKQIAQDELARRVRDLEAERLRPVPPRPTMRSTGQSTADPQVQTKTATTSRRTA